MGDEAFAGGSLWRGFPVPSAPTPKLPDTLKALPSVYEWMALRWQHRAGITMPGYQEFRRQYSSLVSFWVGVADTPQGRAKVAALWPKGKFDWVGAWRFLHADPQWMPRRDLLPAFFAFHASGSIKGSEALCESVASPLKRFSDQNGAAPSGEPWSARP